MRDAHALIKEATPDCLISCLVQHKYGYRYGFLGREPILTAYDGSLRGLLVDLETWADEGLVDDVVAWGNYREGEPGNAATAYREMVDETHGKANVWLFGWLTETDFDQTLPLAKELGASRILLWESDYIGLSPENESFVRQMRECAGSV